MALKRPTKLRRYNVWAGNPNGVPEDVTRCIREIGGLAHQYQCMRKRGHGPDGLYCKQHDPRRIEAREKARQRAQQTKFESEFADRMRPRRQLSIAYAALQSIASDRSVTNPKLRASQALKKMHELGPIAGVE